MTKNTLELLPKNWIEWLTINLAKGRDPVALATLMAACSGYDTDLARSAIEQILAICTPISEETKTEQDNRTIFISIASYCDPLLWHTIEDCVRNAARPDLLRFAVVDQNANDGRAELASLPFSGQVRYVHLHPIDARGPCWARSIAFGLYNGEDYLLQLDSHMIFDPGWDAVLKEQLEALSGTNPKIILSTYPWGFRIENGEYLRERHSDGALVMAVKDDQALKEDCPVLLFRPKAVVTPSAVRGFELAAGFLFTRGSFIEEIPYDPYLYFHGEEQSLSVRSFTHGWDIYHPVTVPLYHLYKSATEPNLQPFHCDESVDKDRSARWWILEDASKKRLCRLLYDNGIDGAYGLGKMRTLKDYAALSGIDFEKRTFQRRTPAEIAQHSLSPLPQDRESTVEAIRVPANNTNLLISRHAQHAHKRGRGIASKIAAVVYIENKDYLLRELAGLYCSIEQHRLPIELVVFGTAAALEAVPPSIVARKIVAEPISYANDELNGYHFINSISCLTGANARHLEMYDYLLRTDCDVFLTPGFPSSLDGGFYCGHGAYVHFDAVRNKLTRIAEKWGIKHGGMHNVGSTWLGPARQVIDVATHTVEYTRRLLREEFTDGDGEWPNWFRGVASMYGGELAVNHLLGDRCTRLTKIDAHCDDTALRISEVWHIHCWHTNRFFNKFDARAGRYDDLPCKGYSEDMAVPDYCLYQFLESKKHFELEVLNQQ